MCSRIIKKNIFYLFWNLFFLTRFKFGAIFTFIYFYNRFTLAHFSILVHKSTDFSTLQSFITIKPHIFKLNPCYIKDTHQIGHLLQTDFIGSLALTFYTIVCAKISDTHSYCANKIVFRYVGNVSTVTNGTAHHFWLTHNDDFETKEHQLMWYLAY